MANSTKPRRSRNHQSVKPHPDYPLTAHVTGRWCKKIRGKVHFFGKIDDPDAALNKWLEQKDDLLAGRVPRAKQPQGLALHELVNRFLNFKRDRVTTGELSLRTWAEYKKTGERLTNTFGRDRLVTDITSEDFEKLRADISKKNGLMRLGSEVQRTRSVFKYGYDAGLIDRPVRFGPGFKTPTRRMLRKQRAERGPLLFEPQEIRDMLANASVPLRAMLLLAINAGYGNSDIANLPMSALDLEGGWATFPRPKTAADRRCKLWPETIDALRAVLAKRKNPVDEEHAQLVFITVRGAPWATDNRGSAITHEMQKLLQRLKIKRPRHNFYTLRHTFRTVADGTRDMKACNYIMGHVDASMAGQYIEAIDDNRIEAVADYVHDWLFGKGVQS